MPALPQHRRQPGRRLRSGTQLGGQEEEQWCPAATFGFPESPPVLRHTRSDKLEKMKSPKDKKLRRQTMIPKRAAATTTITSPTLSQRRTRRQSMLPLKLCSPLVRDPPKKRASKTKPVLSCPSDPPTKAESKRKLSTEIAPVETRALPATKKRRLIAPSKSSSHVKTPDPPATTSRKHKSLSFLPVTHSTCMLGNTKQSNTQQDYKMPSPATSKHISPVRGRKPPAKKRELSPSCLEASSPAPKKASQPSPGKMALPHKGKAATRSHSDSHMVRRKSLPRSHKKGSKVPEKGTTPSPKKILTSKTRTSSVRLQAAAEEPSSSSSSLDKISTTTSRKESCTSLKISTSPSLSTPKKTPKKKSALAPKIPTTPTLKEASAHTPKEMPKAGSKRTKSTKKTTPSSGKKTQKKTPTLSSRKAKPPMMETPNTPSSMKEALSYSKATPPPSTPSHKHRPLQSAAKIQASLKKLKVVLVKVNAKSPPSSASSFRKTPSSKKATAVSSTTDTGASPALPSARMQLQRIRDTISSTQKHSSSTRPSQHESPSLSATAATPNLGMVVTKADIHASGNGKCSSELAFGNHCDPWQGSTPTARPPMPPTPKSSRGSSSSVSHFSSRVASSTISVQHLKVPAPTQSSTPIKGSHTLEVIGLRPSPKREESSGSFSESMEEEAGDSVDGEREDTSVEEESIDSEGDSGLEESVRAEYSSVREKAEIENTTENRRNYCILM